ncbi:alpha/beta hydrolase [soil metagenome]
MRRTLAITLTVAVALTGAVTVGTTPSAAAPPTGGIAWGACEDDPEAEFQCGTLTVPLDYADPASGTIDIAIIRLPADPARREGAVLFNPGGPGGSGYDFTMAAAKALDSGYGLNRRFDLVGFDPRGVDRSHGLRCVDDSVLDAGLYLDDTPDDTAEELALVLVDAAFAAGCLERYGDTLIDYSTANTAADMDRIRSALGDEQISYVGISYGTYLGAVYATMFPDRVRAMVLDSAFEPTGDSLRDQYVTQLVGFEEAFDNFAAWCEEMGACAFADIDVSARWIRLMTSLDANPIKSDSGRPVNQVVGELATIASLYNELSWPELGQALAEAEQGDGTRLLALADDYNGRHPDGTFDTIAQSGDIIRCASGIDRDIPPDPAGLAVEVRAASPRFARNASVDDFTDDCLAIMGQDVAPVVPSYSGPAPIVVLGGTNDPATPFRWAEELAALLGPSARLLTYTGEGHGQVLSASCVTQIEGAVIASLQLPAVGTTCNPDPDVPRPPFWDALPVPPGVGEMVDDPGIDSALGLSPSLAYTSSWFYTADTATLAAAYRSALDAMGFLTSEPQELFPGVLSVPALAPDGTGVSALLFSPEAIATDPDLEGLVDIVPAGQGLVVIAAFPDG